MKWLLKDCRHLITDLHLSPHKIQGHHSLENSSGRFILFFLHFVIHSLHHLWLTRGRYWQAVQVCLSSHKSCWMRLGTCFRGCKSHVDPSTADSRSPLDPNLAVRQWWETLAAPARRPRWASCLVLQAMHLCDSWTKEDITVQLLWHSVLITPHLINYNLKNYHY